MAESAVVVEQEIREDVEKPIEGTPNELAGLGSYLRDRFNQVASDRRMIEQEWIRSLRQYLGYYDEADTIPSDQTQAGSKAFVRITRSKVRAMDARMMNVLFPGGTERNWKISPTTNPELPPLILQKTQLALAADKLLELNQQLNTIDQETANQMQAAGEWPNIQAMYGQLRAGQIPQGISITEEDLEEAIEKEAGRRADLMESEIADQLDEIRYRQTIKKCVHSGNLFGTGWIKGPTAEKSVRSAWFMKDGEWILMRKETHRPVIEFVPIWDVYPDSIDVSNLDECEGIFQRYVMGRSHVRGLKKREGFDKEAIEDYLLTHPKGDVGKLMEHEEDLRNIRREDQGTLANSAILRYEVLEWTGYADGQALMDMGVDLPRDAEMDSEYKASIWVMGDMVVRAALTLYDDDMIQTYHRYVLEESDTGLYGIGIPEIMRDPQRGFNASIRAAIDNMAFSAAPILDVNIDLLDPREIRTANLVIPRRVYLRKGRDQNAMAPAVRPVLIPSRVREFTDFGKLFLDLADEATNIPRYVTGNEKISGAGATASGLSMLFSQADIMLGDAVNNYDEGITKPLINGMYHWNMQFNERNDIKGDYSIRAMGSTALIAKEVRAQRLEQFAAQTLNPIDAPLIKRQDLLRQRAKVQDIDPDEIILSDDEISAEQQRAEQQAQFGGQL